MYHYLNDEVAYINVPIRTLSYDDINMLIDKAKLNKSGRFRICMHNNPQDLLHEMLIALRNDVYYPPHRAINTEETHFILYGLATLYIYTDDGSIYHTFHMGANGSDRISYVRIPKNMFHCLIIESDVCVYYESKLGPFNASHTEIACFECQHMHIKN